MQQICTSLSTGNTVSSISEGRNCKTSLGILMQVITNS